MTDSASDTFRSALNDTPSPAADAPATMPDVFADEAPVSFDDIPGEPEAAPEPKPEAPKPAEPAPKPDDQPPSWRLREMREERDRIAAANAEYQRKLAEYERKEAEREAAKQPEPEFYEDPAKFVDHRSKQQLSPIEKAIQELRDERQAEKLQDDAERVVGKYGQDKFLATLNAAKQLGPDFEKHLLSQRRPYSAMMEWGDRNEVQKLGTSVEEIRKNLRQEFLNDPEFVAQVMETTRQGARPVFERPQPPRAANGQFEQLPSLNRTAAASTGDEPDTPGDTYRQALRAPRGR